MLFYLVIFLGCAQIINCQKSATNPCQSSMDCSLNGDCVNSLCQCDPAWHGSRCELLSILPTGKNSGYHNSTQASWGSNVVLVDGVYHMFAAQFANSCPLAYWGSNSMIIRAESKSYMGPFEYKETIVPAFSHNPTIRKGFDGAYYLFMIGDGTNQNVPDCSNTTVKDRLRSASLDQAKRVTGEPFPTSIHVTRAESVFGPWEPLQTVYFTDSSEMLCGGHTNPSPHFNPDGSVYLAFQAQPCESEHHSWALVGVAKADSWKGPYTLVSPDPVTPMDAFNYHPVCVAGQDEDPFLWRSSRGFHLLTHGMCPSGVRQAHLKYSMDGVVWSTAQLQTYHYTVPYDDDTEHMFARVERPQLYFSHRDESTGYYDTPLALYNGVCGTGEDKSDYECVFDQLTGMTWSLARPIASV